MLQNTVVANKIIKSLEFVKKCIDRVLKTSYDEKWGEEV